MDEKWLFNKGIGTLLILGAMTASCFVVGQCVSCHKHDTMVEKMFPILPEATPCKDSVSEPLERLRETSSCVVAPRFKMLVPIDMR